MQGNNIAVACLAAPGTRRPGGAAGSRPFQVWSPRWLCEAVRVRVRRNPGTRYFAPGNWAGACLPGSNDRSSSASARKWKLALPRDSVGIPVDASPFAGYDAPPQRPCSSVSSPTPGIIGQICFSILYI